MMGRVTFSHHTQIQSPLYVESIRMCLVIAFNYHQTFPFELFKLGINFVTLQTWNEPSWWIGLNNWYESTKVVLTQNLATASLLLYAFLSSLTYPFGRIANTYLLFKKTLEIGLQKLVETPFKHGWKHLKGNLFL